MSHFCKHTQHLLAFLAFGVACLAGRPVYAQYSYTTIDAPGATNTRLTGISNDGRIVGYYYDASFKSQAFLDTNGIFISANHPAGVNGTIPSGINNSGQIVGKYVAAMAITHSYEETNGVFTTIDVPDAIPNSTTVTGINDAGQIIGDYASLNSNRSYISHGFVDIDEVFSTIDAPNAIYSTTLSGINNFGQIIGTVLIGNYNYDFIYKNGLFTTLNDPGEATGINDSGQIAGISFSGAQVNGFIETNGVFTVISDPLANNTPLVGTSGTFVTGVNSAGQTVGYYYDASENAHGFLATPLPRPKALTATVSGSSVVLKWRAAAGSVLHYNVYRGTTPSSKTLYKSAGKATAFTDSVVTKGTPYFYHVKAVSSAGTSFPSNQAIATP